MKCHCVFKLSPRGEAACLGYTASSWQSKDRDPAPDSLARVLYPSFHYYLIIQEYACFSSRAGSKSSLIYALIPGYSLSICKDRQVCHSWTPMLGDTLTCRVPSHCFLRVGPAWPVALGNKLTQLVVVSLCCFSCFSKSGGTKAPTESLCQGAQDVLELWNR